MSGMEGRQWAVRGPGMPQKILRSDKPLKEAEVKKLYLMTVRYKASDIDRGNNTEVPWKIVPVSDDDIQKANLGWCLRETARRNHQALIEVQNGKLINGEMVDGKFVPHLKPAKPVPRERTRVDVSLTPKK